MQALDTFGFLQTAEHDLPTGTREVRRMHVPTGRQEMYAATRRGCAGGGCSHYAIERVPGPGWAATDAGYRDLLPSASNAIVVKDVFTTAPGETQLAADAAWVCYDSAGTGTCKSVVGLADFDTASVLTVGVTSRVYVALAKAPDGGERLYAVHSGGVDAIRTKTLGQATVQNVLAYPVCFGSPLDMDSGTTDGGNKRIYVVSAGKLAVYTLPGSLPPINPTTTVTLGGSAVGVDLTTDGRFVLVTRHPLGDDPGEAVTVVTTYDADSLSLVRENATATCGSAPCDTPPPTPMALSVDVEHAFVSEPGTGRIAYLYTDTSPRPYQSLLVETIEATRDDAWVSHGAKVSTLQQATTAMMLLDLAAQAGSEEARKALVRQAAAKLYDIRASIDGCFGRDDGDDVMTSCYEAAGVWNVSGALLGRIAEDLIEAPTLP